MKPKIGIALGGGGARGISHVGVLKALEREGIKVDMIVGVSMGALIGACYAIGMPIEDIEKEILSFNKTKALRKLVDLSPFKKSILFGRKTHKYINDITGEKTFADTKIPFKIVATNLSTGEQVILNKGNLTNAIQASICVPGIFPPVKIGDNYLIDGGVANPTPVDVVDRMGADIIIGVDLTLKRHVKLERPGIVATLMQSYEIIRNQAIKSNLDKVNKNVIMILPDMRAMSDSFKFYDMHKFIESGEKAAEKVISEIKKQIEQFE